VANAGQTGVIDTDTLYVKRAFVNVGASQKRFRPAPMGRAHKYRRRTSHITIVVDEA
jgi:large subunit ribosomal protein L22